MLVVTKIHPGTLASFFRFEPLSPTLALAAAQCYAIETCVVSAAFSFFHFPQNEINTATVIARTPWSPDSFVLVGAVVIWDFGFNQCI